MILGDQSVLSLSLQKNGDVFAIKLRKKDNSFEVTHSKKYLSDASLGNIRSDFELKNQDCIIAGDSGDLSTVLALILPKMKVNELHHAIRFSLTSQLPLNPAEIYYGYQSRDNFYKIIAFNKSKWTFIKNRLSGIKLDAYCPMLACESDDLSFKQTVDKNDLSAEQNIEILNSSTLPDLADFMSDYKVQWDKKPEESELYFGAIIQGVYALGKHFKKDCNTLPEFPKELQLKHHEWMRYALIASVIYIIFYGGFGAFSYYSAKDSDLQEILELDEQIKSETPIIDDADFLRLEEFKTEFKSLKKKHPYSISQLLNELSLRLPMSCYLRDLRVNDSSISCRILSSSGQIDIQEIYDQFKASNYFEDDILITRQSTEVTLTLKVLKELESE